jgi:hypothetical protein
MDSTTQEAGKAGAHDGARLRVHLCFSNHEITDLLAFALDAHFDCDVRSFQSAGEAVAALKEGAALLVLDGAREDTGVLLEAANAHATKVAVHHPKKEPPSLPGVDLVGVFNEPELLPGVSAALKQLGAKARNPQLAGGNASYPFIRVGVPLLLRTDPLVSDVFVKLSELKYLKLFHKGASFGPEDVAKYHGAKKIEFFHVKTADAAAVAAKLNAALEQLLRELPPPGPAVTTPVSLATIDTVHSLVNQVGFTPEVERLVKNNVDLVLKEMYASPSLGAMLGNLDRDREKYIASHSHALAEVACALSIAMKWDSDVSFRKITMAALLHDLGLSNQKLARMKDLKEISEHRGEFSPSDVEDYRSHPRRMSVLVAGMKEVPADVDKIILQHHELPMGTGFPDQLQHVHIHPLASLFMVAHDLVDWVFDHPGELNVETFIEAYLDKYKAGNFRKILKALYSLQG